MIEIRRSCEHIELLREGARCADLVYSEDDAGYYVQRHSDDKTSPVFDARGKAIGAFANPETVEWS